MSCLARPAYVGRLQAVQPRTMRLDCDEDDQFGPRRFRVVSCGKPALQHGYQNLPSHDIGTSGSAA